ncbi:MAG: hypothetical protein DRI61_14675, partial [Chloroflexi bacterium]
MRFLHGRCSLYPRLKRLAPRGIWGKILLLLLFILGSGALPQRCKAEEPALPVLIPLTGQDRVHLHSLAVDIFLEYEPLRLKFTASYRFQNPNPFNARMITFRLQTGDLEVEDLKVLIGEEEYPAPVPEKALETLIPPASKGEVLVQGDFSLEGYPLVRLIYPLDSAALWAGSVSSIRVTVHFPHLTPQDQLVVISPSSAYFDGFRLSWQWVEVEPSNKLELTLIHPSLWNRMEELTELAQKGSASAREWYELGVAYRNIALALPSDSPVFDGFYREAIACLEEARRIEPSLYQASLDLAALYRHKAFLPGGKVKAPYAALSIMELEKALDMGAPKAPFAWPLQELYISLGQQLQESGEMEESIGYFNKALQLTEEGFAGPKTKEELERMMKDSYALWAEGLLSQGEYEKALSLIAEGLGADFWKLLGIRLPLCKSARALVIMKPEVREEICICSQGPLFNPLDEDIAALRSAFPELEFREEAGRLVLYMELPFSDTEGLQAGMREKAAYVPVRGEFGACLAGLKGAQIRWEWRSELWGRRLTFGEQVDMSEAKALLDLEEAAIKRREGEIQGSEIFQTEPLQRLALTLCRIAREEWSCLRDNTTLEYELVLESGVRQSWFLKPGGVISLERELWEPYPWVKPMFGLLVFTLVLLFVLLLFRLHR